MTGSAANGLGSARLKQTISTLALCHGMLRRTIDIYVFGRRPVRLVKMYLSLHQE
jgi:hypothetical protein